MNQEVVQFLPEVAFVVGAGLGATVDALAQRRGDAQRESVLHTAGVSRDEFDRMHPTVVGKPVAVDGLSNKQVNENARDMTRFAVPASMAVAAGLLVSAWMPTHAAHSKKSTISVVGDRSGITEVDGSYKKVDGIFKQFTETGDVKIRAIMANKTSVNKIELDRIDSTEAIGRPTIDQAVGAELNNAYDATVKMSADKQPNTGLLAVTDGNSIGHPSTVIKQAHENGDTPVFVVNVGKQDSKNVDDFKRIAKATGGQYWGSNSNPKTVADTVRSKVSAQEVAEPVETDGKGFEKFLSIVMVGLSAELLRRRAELRFRGPQRLKGSE